MNLNLKILGYFSKKKNSLDTCDIEVMKWLPLMTYFFKLCRAVLENNR